MHIYYWKFDPPFYKTQINLNAPNQNNMLYLNDWSEATAEIQFNTFSSFNMNFKITWYNKKLNCKATKAKIFLKAFKK